MNTADMEKDKDSKNEGQTFYLKGEVSGGQL